MKKTMILALALMLVGVFANPAMATNKSEQDILISPEVQKALDRNEGKLANKKGSDADNNKIICRKVSRPGSRISRRVCLTAAEEKQRRADDRQALRTTRETEFPQPTAQ